MNEALDVYIMKIIEAALFIADTPMNCKSLKDTVLVNYDLNEKKIMEYILALQDRYKNRGIELIELQEGFCFTTNKDLNSELSLLWQEKAPKYTRAFVETLAIIAYRQPITRGQIERIRGVSLSSNIMRSLLEREWVKVVGYKEVPGRPALYATTIQFLNYFGLKSLSQLPTLDNEGALDILLKETLLDTEISMDLNNSNENVKKVKKNDTIGIIDTEMV